MNINYNFNNFRLFGNEDVDLRTLGVDSDSSAISDKKNASKLVSCRIQQYIVEFLMKNSVLLFLEGRKLPSVTC